MFVCFRFVLFCRVLCQIICLVKMRQSSHILWHSSAGPFSIVNLIILNTTTAEFNQKPNKKNKKNRIKKKIVNVIILLNSQLLPLLNSTKNQKKLAKLIPIFKMYFFVQSLSNSFLTAKLAGLARGSSALWGSCNGEMEIGIFHFWEKSWPF